jgi:hypothetical protein
MPSPDPQPLWFKEALLRNHDELTLEVVSDVERAYMIDEYARDPDSRIYLGIRRRSRRCSMAAPGGSS